eukprot:XP_011610433.1 PREDICTED: neurofilament light polypeptide-like isoform X4 [Takifugu rubripes]
MKMMDLNLENPKLSAPPPSSSSPSSSASSATSHPSHHSLKQLLQCSDLSCCHGSHTEHTHSQEVSERSRSPKCISLSPNMEAPEIKISPTSNNRKGRAELGALPRGPLAPKCPKPCDGLTTAERKNQKEHQKPLTAATTAKRSINPKNENLIIKALLASQQVQIKRLRNVNVELQNEIESVKKENRTLKQVQARLQNKVVTENKFEELKAQYAQDTHVMQEQLRRYKEQLRAAEQTIKDNNQTILKAQMKDKKNEQTITHMQQLLAKKDLETREKLQGELEKERKVAQEAEERAATIERKAELANNLHRKLLLAEKKKSAAAVEEISVLMEKVRDLNHVLMVKNTKTPADSGMKEVTKVKQDNTKEKDSGRETMRRQESERTTQGWSKHMRSVKTYTKASVKTDETRKSSSNHLHAAKTYMKTSEKPDETKAIVLGGSNPVDKADSEPTEKTPDDSPPSQKPTKLEESQLNNGEQQEHEEKKEKRRKKQDTKRSSPEVEKPKSLGEDQMLSEMTAISREEQMDQSAATGVSRPASSSQCSTEGIAVLSLKSWTSQRSLNKEVETDAVKMIESLDDHSFQDKLLGQRQGPAGDAQNLLDDPDDNQQTAA